MKKVLFITTTPFYQEKGSSLRVYSMAKMLSSEYIIDLVTYSLGENKIIPNVTIHRTPAFFKPKVGVSKISPSKVILDFFVFLKCLSLIARYRYDIIHCEDFEAAFLGRCLLLFNKKKFFVYDLHNRILDNLTIKESPSQLLRELVLRCESFVVRRCNLVILNWNKYSGDDIFKNTTTILYYDQVDVDTIEPCQLTFKGEYLVYAGNFEPYQGIREFVEVFSKCDVNYKLVLIGSPSQEIVDFVQKDNLSDRVILAGRLSVPQTNYFIKNSIAGILPRISGVQPSMKMIHYFLHEKPVIAANIECNLELIKNNMNGFTYSNEMQLINILNSINNGEHSLLFKEGLVKTKTHLRELTTQEMFLGKYYAR